MKVIRTIYPKAEPLLVIRNQTYSPDTDTPILNEEMETWPEVIAAIREKKIEIVEA